MSTIDALLRFLDASNNAQDINIIQRLRDLYHALGVREQGESDASGYVEALSVSVGTSDDLFNATSTEIRKVYGWVLTGETDAIFTLTIGGTDIHVDQITGTQPISRVVFPRPIHVDPNVNIQLSVLNDGLATKNFKGFFSYEEVDE